MRLTTVLALLPLHALADPIALTDTTGARVALDAPATRVVTIDNAAFGMMAALGLTPVGAAARDDARRDSTYLFPDGEAIPNVGSDPSTPDPELVAAVDPDLVVGWVDEHRPSLEGIAPYYAFAGLTDLASYHAALRDLGRLTGREAEAEAAIARFEDRAAAYAALAPERPTVLKFSMIEGGLGWVNTVMDPACQVLDLVVTCAWTNPAGGSDSYQTTIEGVLALDPDVILIGDGDGPPGDEAAMLDAIEATALWPELRAVREGRVIVSDDPEALNADSIVGFNRALDAVVPALFPDAFPNGALTDEEVAAALASP